jgi:hypothetical protein
MKRLFLYGFVVFSVILISWMFFIHHQIKPSSQVPENELPFSIVNGPGLPIIPSGGSNLPSADNDNPYERMTLKELRQNKPHISRAIIPETPQDVAMWQWREAMEKADPGYTYKTPIVFYGKVVNQNNQPIQGAIADMHWTGTRGEALDKATVISGAEGRFALEGVSGKLLVIWIHKENCIGGTNSQGDYNYADFYEPNYHVPDSNQPVIFSLWTLGDPEPMYKFNYYCDLTADGKPSWFDLKTGRSAPTGNIGFSVIRHSIEKGLESGYSIVVQAGLGGGIALSNGEEFLFQAPLNGYQPMIQIEQPEKRSNSDMEYKLTRIVRCYLKTADGKYAAIDTEIILHAGPEAQLMSLIYYNPSGSRNLEYDYRKQIDR